MNTITMTQEQFTAVYEKAAQIGAEAGIRAFKKAKENEYKDKTDKRLRNTKLLLRNYRMLKQHAENSVFGRTQMEESAADILESMMSIYDNEVIVDSIKRSASRTAIIVAHIETMLGLYESYCDKNGEVNKRRYHVLWDRYIAERPINVRGLTRKYNMSKENVYLDLKIAMKTLSALIFGVDGLNVH